MNALSKQEYLNTFGEKMRDVTGKALPVLDIRPAVWGLVELGVIGKSVYERGLVEMVYRNELGTFEHVLIPIGKQRHLVMLVNLIDLKLEGYYDLNLDREYSL